MNIRNLITQLSLALVLVGIPSNMRAQPPAQGPPPTPKAQQPWDPTGTWVSIITEDWRWRMITPDKGDAASVPLNAVGRKLLPDWDPAKDEAAGEQCKSYGAPAIMRTPTRLRIGWDNETTLKVEADNGTQTRLFQFSGTPSGMPSWQGWSAANWELVRGNAGGGGFGRRKPGSLKVVTTRLRPGYLRKNGVPYSDKTTVTEYWDLLKEANGEQWIIVKTLVEDPAYLNEPFTTSSNFKKQADGAGWSPSACTAR